MKVFTVINGKVLEGTSVGKFTLKNVDLSIPAVIVGEKGRGRRLGVLPVALTPEQQQEWDKTGQTQIDFVKTCETNSCKPKLIAHNSQDSKDKSLIVFLTEIGFRGGNNHTGDTDKEKYITDSLWIDDPGFPKKEFYSEEDVQRFGNQVDFRRTFFPFPGEVLVSGTIAQGDAGRMGSGQQIVAVMPKNVVFRTGYYGRLYGKPHEHFYLFTGEKILSVTREERELTDIF